MEQTLGALLIVRNEEDYLPFTIKSLWDVDQLVIINNGSIDNTKNIIKHFQKDREIIYDETDILNISEVRNFGLSKITTDWVINFDADAIFFKRAIPKIREIINLAKERENAFALGYLQFAQGHRVANNTISHVFILLKKRDNKLEWKGVMNNEIFINEVRHSVFDPYVPRIPDFVFCHHYSWCFMKRVLTKKFYYMCLEHATLEKFRELHKFSLQFLGEPYFEFEGDYKGEYPEVVRDSWIVSKKSFSLPNYFKDYSNCSCPEKKCEFRVQFDPISYCACFRKKAEECYESSTN